MFFKRFYDTKLAQASYLIGCQQTGDALVVDPNRDVEQYVTAADAEGLRIAFVTETHIHADFVSGSRELAARTGAQLLLSDEGDAEWKYAYAADAKARLLKDGDSFMVGNVRIEALHTPGHTPEHLSFVGTWPAANAALGRVSTTTSPRRSNAASLCGGTRVGTWKPPRIRGPILFIRFIVAK